MTEKDLSYFRELTQVYSLLSRNFYPSCCPPLYLPEGVPEEDRLAGLAEWMMGHTAARLKMGMSGIGVEHAGRVVTLALEILRARREADWETIRNLKQKIAEKSIPLTVGALPDGEAYHGRLHSVTGEFSADSGDPEDGLADDDGERVGGTLVDAHWPRPERSWSGPTQ